MRASFSRLILFRPRPEFPLLPEWESRPWIPLGDLRPLLQAVSPVRDLSDIWRWVALPLSRADVEAALMPLAGVTVRRVGDSCEEGTEHEHRDTKVSATIMPAEAEGAVERVELTPAGGLLMGSPSPEAVTVIMAAAAALRRSCGCVAVGIG